MTHSQLSLFGAPDTMSLPEGFNYRDDILSSEEERVLVKQIAKLPFKEFQYQGFLGKRRVVSFGWRYDFNTRELNKAENIPEFLRIPPSPFNPYENQGFAVDLGFSPHLSPHHLTCYGSP